MRGARLLPMVLALSLASTPVLAQRQLGVIAGANFANMKIEDRSSIDVRTTFAIGGVVDLPINSRLGVRIEPSFLSKGSEATKRNAYWGTMDGAIFKLDYFEIPLLVRYDLAATPTRGYLLGGFGLGYATKQEAELTQGQTNETVDMGDIFSSTDVTIQVGAGVGFQAGGNRVTLDGRFAYGLANINNGGTVTFNGSPLVVPSNATHTADFRVLASYLFPWPGSN